MKFIFDVDGTLTPSRGTLASDFKDFLMDFVNIHDVVDANVLVMEDERADYEMFNVGGGEPMTVREFAKVVADVYGFCQYAREDFVPQAFGKYRFGDTRHICSDISKLNSLGWKPKRTVYDSVREYKEWLDTADSVGDIVDHCAQVMEKLNVVRDVE